jgi:hypothetical protein
VETLFPKTGINLNNNGCDVSVWLDAGKQIAICIRTATISIAMRNAWNVVFHGANRVAFTVKGPIVLLVLNERWAREDVREAHVVASDLGSGPVDGSCAVADGAIGVAVVTEVCSG